MSEFGVVICCCKFDYFLAKGCVASVRQYLGDVPITLFIDGELDARAVAEAYNLSLLYRKDVKDPWLRETNRGWGLPKMTLFWESPYERYLYLDCDTIIWGDVIAAYGSDRDWDMVVDEGDARSRPWVPDVAGDKWVNQEYFNIEKMGRVVPDFPWRKYAGALFCSGTFFARRGAFDLDYYKEVVKLRQDNPGLFPIGEMGILNFMIFRAVEQGKLKLAQRPMELVCDYTNQDVLRKRLQFENGAPPAKPVQPIVLHFTDPKPLTDSHGVHAPFTYFRGVAWKRMHKMSRPLVRLMLRLEELPWRITITYRRKYGRFHRWIKPLMFWK